MTVGITQGDGNGIGYEVIIKALADERMLDLCTPVIYGSSKIFGFYRKQIHNIDQPVNTNVITSAQDVHPKRINIVNCLPDNIFVEPGQATPESAKSAMTSLQRAVEDIRDGYIDVLVTAPINKRAMVNEGFGYTGHTEYLQEQFGVDDVVMIMVSDRLKVAVATGHIPLKDVLVKPLPPIKLTKEVTEAVGTGEKDVDGYEKFDTKTETKEVESEWREGIVLALPNSEQTREACEKDFKVGDTVVYNKKFVKEFDLFKDAILVKPYDIIARKRSHINAY